MNKPNKRHPKPTVTVEPAQTPPQAAQEHRQERHQQAPAGIGHNSGLMPVQLVQEQRQQSNQILSALTKTAVALSGKDGAVAHVEIMERLWGMQKEAEDRQAEREFGIAKVALAMDLPTIPKNHAITFVDKNNAQRETPYADRGDIESVLDPLCRKHGFSKEYSTETVDGKACQVLTVRHVSGHKVVYRSPYMPLDTTGSKNNNQAAGSTAEYGKRYALVGAFNIIGVDKDDDGNKGTEGVETPKGDKFTTRVAVDAAQKPTEPPKLTLKEAADALETKLRNAAQVNRGELFMKHIAIVEAMLKDPSMIEKANELRKLVEEQPYGQ